MKDTTFYGKSKMGNPAPLVVQLIQKSGGFNIHDRINYRQYHLEGLIYWYGNIKSVKTPLFDKHYSLLYKKHH